MEATCSAQQQCEAEPREEDTDSNSAMTRLASEKLRSEEKDEEMQLRAGPKMEEDGGTEDVRDVSHVSRPAVEPRSKPRKGAKELKGENVAQLTRLIAGFPYVIALGLQDDAASGVLASWYSKQQVRIH